MTRQNKRNTPSKSTEHKKCNLYVTLTENEIPNTLVFWNPTVSFSTLAIFQNVILVQAAFIHLMDKLTTQKWRLCAVRRHSVISPQKKSKIWTWPLHLSVWKGYWSMRSKHHVTTSIVVFCLLWCLIFSSLTSFVLSTINRTEKVDYSNFEN